MERISSAHNPLVGLVRSLALRKHRKDTGLFVAQGLEHARKAKLNGFTPHTLLFDSDHAAEMQAAEIIAWGKAAGARLAALPSSLFTRISGRDNPQSPLMIFFQRWQPLEDRPPADPCVLVLDSVRDPGNLGTIMRTAEASATKRLYLMGQSCDPFSPEAVRASAGSVFAMKMSSLTRDQFSKIAKGWTGDIVGTHVEAAGSFRQPYRRPVLLLMGSESRGLPDELAAACTKLVRIPMAQGVQSLNLAAATALMLYELQLPFITDQRS